MTVRCFWTVHAGISTFREIEKNNNEPEDRIGKDVGSSELTTTRFDSILDVDDTFRRDETGRKLYSL